LGLETLDGRSGRLEFEIYIDLPDAQELTSNDSSHFLGHASTTYFPDQGLDVTSMAITKQVKLFVDNRHKVKLTIINTGDKSFKWTKLQIACFANC
jgi:hypothetical protein